VLQPLKGCTRHLSCEGDEGMNVREARRRLRNAVEDDEPIGLPLSVLGELTRADMPEGASIKDGTMRDRCLHLDWNGRLYKDGNSIIGEADHTWTRKYWYSPLGLEQYLDLVRRAVETRQRTHGDVAVTHHDREPGGHMARVNANGPMRTAPGLRKATTPAPRLQSARRAIPPRRVSGRCAAAATPSPAPHNVRAPSRLG
jgi:hypothetical protein